MSGILLAYFLAGRLPGGRSSPPQGTGDVGSPASCALTLVPLLRRSSRIIASAAARAAQDVR